MTMEVNCIASRRNLLIAAAGAALTPGLGPATASTPLPTGAGRGDFDFFTGTWNVRHRKLNGRLVGSTDWQEFTGKSEVRSLMAGLANCDDNVLNDPNGTYRAVTFRRVDPDTGLWNIWWFDGRHGEVGAPMEGRFQDGVGTFLADDTLAGRPIKVRFIWSHITPTSARWEQAFSPDGGETWEVNWYMRFERVD